MGSTPTPATGASADSAPTPSHDEDAAGASPTPAARFDCPFLNKRRLACLSPVLPETGICLEHSKKTAQVVAGLLGA